MGLLHRGGAQLTPRAEDADILVVNTCSFIDSAKQESVDTILEMVQHKIANGGRAQKPHRGRLPGRALPRRDPRQHPRSRRRSRHRRTRSDSRSRGPQPPRHQLPLPHPDDSPNRPPRKLRQPALPPRVELPPTRPRSPLPLHIRHLDRSAAQWRDPCIWNRLRTLTLPSRRRRPRSRRPFLPRNLGRRHRGPPHLPLLRRDPAHPHHPSFLGLHQNRRRLRPPLQLLHHPAASRQVPFPPSGQHRSRSQIAHRARRPRDHPHRPGHHLLRRRPPSPALPPNRVPLISPSANSGDPATPSRQRSASQNSPTSSTP